MIFFTSDTHFGHAGAIKYCRRPFATVEEMDEELIRRWNAVVEPTDTIYHLGDLSFKGKDYTARILDRLNGVMHLYRGNHDKGFSDEWLLKWFASVQDIGTIKVSIRGQVQRIVLCHYALRTWDMIHHGAWHLFGHSHGNMKVHIMPSLDVGVDCWSYAPVSIDEIVAKLEGVPYTVVDHHGEIKT